MSNRDIENEITSFFNNKDEVKSIQNKILIITRQIKEIENDIQTTNISLSDGVGAIRYDTDKLDVGFKENAFEKQLEVAITRLEQSLMQKKSELIQLKLELHELESNICDFERMLAGSGIDDDMLFLLKLKYKKNMTNIRIGIEVEQSKSTIHRKIKESFEKLTKYINQNQITLT